jgi:cyclic pyranopterin phosphate synthase
MNSKLSHTDKYGKASMVDVTGKPSQIRQASATGFIRLNSKTIELIRTNKVQKGDVLTLAEIAGIQAAKKTSELIPLCHPLSLTKVDVSTSIEADGIRINSHVRCLGQTGVEMEALVAVNVALITVYDMCKAVDKKMIIEDIRLISKEKKEIHS